MLSKLVFNMVETESPEELPHSLVRKPRAVSVVWDYFGLKQTRMVPL